MSGRWFAAGILAAVGLLVWSGASRGGDTIRLNMVDNAPTKNLVDDGQGAKTITTCFGGWGWGGWGWGGFYSPWACGWGGFYSPWGCGWGGCYSPWVCGWGGFYQPFYSFGIAYGGFFPCSGAMASVYALNTPGVTPGSPLPGYGQPNGGFATPQPLPGDNGTFPYDGGPQRLVPTPTPQETAPSSTPRAIPLEGRSVSLPKAKAKWTYPAYGETARRATTTPERKYLTRGEFKTRDSR